ncbi:Hsp90 protein-domain-containing protein [Lactifluus volemus]|nr:Hsp90 protein-domain-containing protein [Lactifluus volemus]
MAPPHPLASVPPPLPRGGRNMLIYFFNAATKESTYVRPLPAFPANAPKKEKPKLKMPIPGTDWLRVTTNQGNVFYTNKAKKESVWTVPDEIKEAVELLEKQEEEDRIRGLKKKHRGMRTLNRNVQEVVKRKVEDISPLDEVIISKRPRVDDHVEDEAGEDEGTEDEEESEEEDWQKEAAAQLAKEAEEEKKKQQEEDEKAEEARKAKESAPKLAIPDRVDLSIDEGKALFKTLLREKDINPLHPWDTSLPLFISDPRYVLLPSVAARREAFDEYCRERARELRASRVKKEKEDPKEEFDQLLTAEVKSTRTSWTDFRRQWKKDRRFYGWGRDDREREKRFREFLKELGEKKRVLAQKAEEDFFALLRESGIPQEGAVWKEVKKNISEDPRYDTVGSSSLREELFNTFLSARSSQAIPDQSKKQIDASSVEQVDEIQKRKDRKAQAVKDREEKIRAERERVQANIEKSRIGLNREEGELQFRTLLTDAIREPQNHVGQLRRKHLDNLHALFLSNAPSLATEFTTLPITSLLTSLPGTKLGFDVFKLEEEFDRWKRTRTTEAQKAFDDMLLENSFIEFWGRLSKLGGEGVDGGVKRDDDGDEDEGEGGGGNVDMKKLAKTVDITEMEKVLKGDKRYIIFDHVPEQRERWLRPKSGLLVAIIRSEVVLGMRFHSFFITGFALVSYVLAQDLTPEVSAEKHHYQLISAADVTAAKSLLASVDTFTSLGNSDVFLRELISNANDALEKLRLTSLTNKDVWDGTNPLNITIRAVSDEDKSSGRIIITDNGIGMTPEEMTRNLGTLAKSGTAEFLAQAEDSPESANNGNLIGSFGLGFYSSFLVADQVYVASVPAKTSENPNPEQYIFSSSSDDNDFSTYPDPRGNTLERGTEITLVLKSDALEYLEHSSITQLVSKHSAFSSSFPIYLYRQREEEVPEPEEPVGESPASDEEIVDHGEDEAVIEEVEDSDSQPSEVKKKTILVDDWAHLNAAPLFGPGLAYNERLNRDSKNITAIEYELFYQSTFLDFNGKPLAWNHFSGDVGSGISFRALLYIPAKLPDDFWQGAQTALIKGIRLMVKRTFITSDFGEDYLPKWASWVKAVIDEKFAEAQKVYGTAFKLGVIEDSKNSDKLAPLMRFATNQRNSMSLDDYIENKKAGQKQIFYVSDAGKSVSSLAKSVFVEKLHARGYEVLLLTDSIDEILLHHLKKWKGIPFQDAAKAGLQFGDEDLDPEEEKARQAEIKEKYKPLLVWLKKQVENVVRDVIISDRLVTSPCAIVADAGGYTANIQRIMSATNKNQDSNMMFEFAKRQKVLELNPRSPLIEGLLRRVEQLPVEDEERDFEAEDELREVASILIDGALVRSGFEVSDSNEFLMRVDRVLRRSLGVSETAATDATVKPAPPVDPVVLDESEYESKPEPVAFEPPENDDGKPKVILSDEMKKKIKVDIEEYTDDLPSHDEL